MANLVKSGGGNWNITNKQKKELGIKLLKFVLNKKANNPKLSDREALSGFGKILIDGKEQSIGSLSKFISKNRNITNPKKISTIALTSKEKQAEYGKNRALLQEQQTGKNVVKHKPSDTPKGFEGHHRRMLKMFAPFYDGLEPGSKEAKEVTQYFIDEGFALGDAEANFINMTPEDHDRIHAWMMDNNIQVKAGGPGWSNIIRTDDGTIRGAKGGSDLQPGLTIGRARMPYLGDLSMGDRFTAISDYLEYVQKPVEGKIDEIQGDRDIFNRIRDLKKQQLEAQGIDLKGKTSFTGQLDTIKTSPSTIPDSLKIRPGIDQQIVQTFQNIFSRPSDVRGHQVRALANTEHLEANTNRPDVPPGQNLQQIEAVANSLAKMGLNRSLDIATGGQSKTLRNLHGITQGVQKKNPLQIAQNLVELEFTTTTPHVKPKGFLQKESMINNIIDPNDPAMNQ